MNNMRSEFAFAGDIFRAIRRHWVASVAFFLCFNLFVLALLLVVPRSYESIGIFYVRNGRGSMTLDPTATTSKTVSIQETREAEINSISDVLGSRGVAEQVVDKIGVDRILESGNTWVSQWMGIIPELPSFNAADESESVDEGIDYASFKRREKAVREILGNIKVKPTRKAATISIRARAATPVLAREIVDAMMEVYQNVHIEANRTDGAYDFFVHQFKLQDDRVAELTGEIRDFKNKINISSIDGERMSLQEQINVVDKAIIQAKGELASSQQRVGTLKSKYVMLDDRLVTEIVEGHSNEGTDLMRDRLFELEILVNRLLVDFSPDHPKVQAAKRQLAEARKLYAAQPVDRAQTKEAVNPTKLGLQSTLINAQAVLSGVQAQLESLTMKRQSMTARLERLNNNEVKLDELDRRLAVARTNYRTYADKLEEARINRELDHERISNVKVVQPASLVLKAASPKRFLIMSLSLITSFGAAIVLAQFLAAADAGMHSPEEVVRHLNIPVLAELPRNRSRRVISH